MASYIPHTERERADMLKTVGAASLDELFADIPAHLRLNALNMPDGLSEQEVYDKLHDLSHRNAHDLVTFLGGGFYDHAIPAAVDSLVSRGEFFTAYTPYQPEVAQGTLQAIFEYQTMICRLTGMDAANASMYDGGTALAEAAIMAKHATGRNTIILAGGVNPIYRRMIESYTRNLGMTLLSLPAPVEGCANRAGFAEALNSIEDAAAIILQNPNFFGTIDDFTDLAQMAREKGTLVIASVYPIALGILKRPREMGVDIVVGEGQSLGLPLSFGGPYLGFMATTSALVRKMPGRIVGETLDRKGQRSYVLTLQAREQHIRRERATSNICSNEALCALRATIFLSLIGKEGLREMATQCVKKAEYAKKRLGEIPGVNVRSACPTFNEFVIELPKDAAEITSKLVDKGFAPGLPLSRYYPELPNCLLVAVTEKRSKREIDALATALEGLL